MKNIADVNSDDILSELNNLDYDDDDLKLLDDEDIKPISSSKEDDDLADFYMDYEEPKKEEKTDIFKDIDPNNMTPIEALNKLYELKMKYNEKK